MTLEIKRQLKRRIQRQQIARARKKSERTDKWIIHDNEEYVKFDLHCHTHEGSIDSKVRIVDYAKKLKEQGFGGMLVTDHDSFGGYRAYEASPEKVEDFVVMRGIEYDSLEYGHIIVVLPDTAPAEVFELLEMRGLALWKLIYIVHAYGGILGPAHPGGEPFLSFASTKYWKLSERIMHLLNFDFIEGYNSCESEEDNKIGRRLAKEYDLPMTAGSDSHMEDCIGLAYTMLPKRIRNTEDFISYIRSGAKNRIGGKNYGKTAKDKLGKYNKYLVVGFFFYNKMGAIRFWLKREHLAWKLIADTKFTELSDIWDC